MEKTRSSKLLSSFTTYCKKNPKERFWQALRNWAKVGFILVSDSPQMDGAVLEDTFYWEDNGRTKKK